MKTAETGTILRKCAENNDTCVDYCLPLFKKMETWLQVILTVATIEMLLAVILPGVVVYMTLFKTPPEFKHFSLLLLIYSAVDACGGIGGWVTFNQRVPIDMEGLTVFVSYGFCGIFGSYFCFFVEMMNYAPLMFNLTLTTFNMGYRLYLLHKKTPRFMKIVPILAAFAVLFIIVAVSSNFHLFSGNSVLFIVKSLLVAYCTREIAIVHFQRILHGYKFGGASPLWDQG